MLKESFGDHTQAVIDEYLYVKPSGLYGLKEFVNTDKNVNVPFTSYF